MTTRMINTEGTLTPLMYSTSGELGNECQTFYRHLANKITKISDKYEQVLTWVRCRLFFYGGESGTPLFKRQLYCKQRGNRYC